MGWIKLHRDITTHWLWQDAERFKWWCDLLFLAAWEDKKVMHDAHLFTLKRGQVIASINFLSERWGKSCPTIIKFLKLLETEGMIYRQVLYRQTPIINICNYDKYQIIEDTTLYTQVNTQINNQVNTQVNTQVYTNKENKESKEVKNNNLFDSVEVSAKPKRTRKTIPPTLEEIKEYCASNGLIINPDIFFNHYEMTGWRLNNNVKMKDWQAACRKWNITEKERQTTKFNNNGNGNHNSDHPTNAEVIRNTEELIREFSALDEQGVPFFRDF